MTAPGEVLVTTLPADATAPRAARAFTSSLLRGWGLVAILDAVVLLASELVTNAVLHTASAATLTVIRTVDGVRLEVSDSSPVGPARRRHSGVATTGRGLALLDELCDEWGWEPAAGGKKVWFLMSAARDPWSGFGRGPSDLPA